MAKPRPKKTSTEVTTAPKGISLEKMLSLRAKGLSLEDIAGACGCSIANVSIRLKDHMEDIEALEDFKSSKGDTLALYQRKLLNSLNNADIQKASPYQRVGMFGILYDKERLERNQMTEIIGYMDYNRALDQVMAERSRLQEELGLDDIQCDTTEYDGGVEDV